MKVTVDLKTCNDHGECVAYLPQIFSLTSRGELNIRSTAEGNLWSQELPEDVRDALLDAIDNCPTQAIDIEG